MAASPRVRRENLAPRAAAGLRRQCIASQSPPAYRSHRIECRHSSESLGFARRFEALTSAFINHEAPRPQKISLKSSAEGRLSTRVKSERHAMNTAGPPATIPQRILPMLTPLNRFFWTAGKTGRLEILRCDACGYWLHPPAPICPQCLSRNLTPKFVSGRGKVEAFTINHHPWTPAVQVPYAIILVSLDECPHVRITSRLIANDMEAVIIGLCVQVVFEHHDDVWLPFFMPAGEAA